jgi:hypothetical protein
MKTKSDPKKRTIYPHIRIDLKTYEKLRRLAFKRRTKMNAIVRELVANL